MDPLYLIITNFVTFNFSYKHLDGLRDVAQTFSVVLIPFKDAVTLWACVR